MAGSDETSYPTLSPIAVNSYETALCVVPPLGQCHEIERLRSLYDKAYRKWPPHINLVYPFVSPELLLQAKERIHARLTKASPNLPNQVCLNRSGYFPHRTNHTIFISESESAGSGFLDRLRSMTLEALAQEPTPSTFHLTIGQSEDQTGSSRDFLLSKAGLLPKIEFEVHTLAILIRERVPGQDKAASRMKLWSTINISPPGTANKATPLSEFWLSPPNRDEDESDLAVCEDEIVSDESTTTPSFSRTVQPGTTYQYDKQLKQWLPLGETLMVGAAPNDLTFSSYNVLIDSEYPPARERDPLLLGALLSKHALSDILVMQEVSDDFLSYLLADSQIQQQYPFTTHGPPSQSDIGPLPSLRNVVILSKFGFSWELVPFHRRHKGAVVAKFTTINPNSTSPLIVAGVHLTCGLTDGSVAAKKVQLSNLKNFLARKYVSNPWIIAGDFNITTSRYTIDAALKNKSISEQTVKTLASMENMMADMGMVDAWAVARVEAADDCTSNGADELFEGEEGATFNPRENELAAATSGTSNNRPQRYDRILTRPQGCLRINHFNHFGLPQDHDGIQIVPSDHSGIRATMKVMTDGEHEPTGNGDTLKQHPVLRKHLSASLAETSALTAALTAHRMFPDEQEVQDRKSAFAAIKKVLLGSSDDEDTSASDIPMVIVPVGSYALGVWTSASDIDCLCIGSISSKTFFKLARQRITKAEEQGIRLLRKVEAATGTMLELSVNDIYMDLQYCPAARIVERWMELPELHHSDAIFNLSMLSLRKLKPYRDINYIQRSVPSLPTFRVAYRCIKLWAVQRGIYSSKFGYLGGIHITLMLSWICKRLAHDVGTVTAADIVVTFFHHYAHFDWKNDMLYDAFFHKKQSRYQRSAREPMVVLGFHAPNSNVAHTSTVPGLNAIVKEFKHADRLLSQENLTWNEFLSNSGDSTSSIAEFLKSHDSYVQINIQYWGRSLSKGKGLVGWVESRCLLLVVDINRSLPSLEVRIWPARLAGTDTSDPETDYHGCYLIGLSKSFEVDYKSKDEKLLASQALQKTFTRFLDQLHSDNKYYDPSICWIGVSLVKPSEVNGLRLDDREWGDYIPDIDSDSDDEDELEDEPDSSSHFLASRPLPHRPISTSTPVSTAKLRPASDVLNRLRWDPALDPGDYIIGYEDRFLGAKETSLEKWKTEQTDEEFIPQHRILYFKRKGDGVIVWERRTRVDLVFGSGVGAG